MNEDGFELNTSEDDRISLEASAWIAKRDEGFSPEQQDSFLEWMAEHPKHREAYAERLAFWEELNQLSGWRPEHSREPNPDLLAYRAPRTWKTRSLAIGAIAASLVIGLIAFGVWSSRDGVETRMLAFGGAETYENYVLDDGSVVELNRGAEVSVQYSRAKRLVFLHAGEAHFMVAKDPNRPFQVRAGEAIVEATGTAFNVALEEDGVEVLVTEGKVLVDAPSLVAARSDSNFIKRPPREMVAGQRSRLSSAIGLATPEILSVSVKEIEQQLEWKSEDLDFTNVPLSEVMEAFNRRNRTKIVVGDSELLNLPITAKLRSNNLNGFVELLDVALGVEASREDAFRIVLRRKGM